MRIPFELARGGVRTSLILRVRRVVILGEVQARFDDFVDYYNAKIPHQAIRLEVSADLYKISPRPYKGLGELDYPVHDFTATVTSSGK